MAYPPTRICVQGHSASQYTRFIQRVCDSRGLTSSVIEVPKMRVDDFSIADRTNTISGVWPSVEYLMAKYPEPELLHGDGIARCVARSLVHDMLAMNKIDGIFADALNISRWREAFPVGGDRPCLIDLAYLTILDGNSFEYRRLDSAFKHFIQQRSEAA